MVARFLLFSSIFVFEAPLLVFLQGHLPVGVSGNE